MSGTRTYLWNVVPRPNVLLCAAATANGEVVAYVLKVQVSQGALQRRSTLTLPKLRILDSPLGEPSIAATQALLTCFKASTTDKPLPFPPHSKFSRHLTWFYCTLLFLCQNCTKQSPSSPLLPLVRCNVSVPQCSYLCQHQVFPGCALKLAVPLIGWQPGKLLSLLHSISARAWRCCSIPQSPIPLLHGTQGAQTIYGAH